MPDHELENLEAFRPDWDAQCCVCGACPTVTATDLCGPCTWGESDTAYGGWWDDEDEQRYQELKAAETPREDAQIGGAS